MKLSPYRRNLVDYVKANGPRVLVSGSKKPMMMTDEQAMQWLDDRVPKWRDGRPPAVKRIWVETLSEEDDDEHDAK